ncbi:phage tail protein [Serratia fonticola]|uniref:phage tail protein n=1 Tax=Serratia fonticola TaxID=47917 RepID=UPI0016467BB2|nr:phage tail protein [Serratia fonticola]MBC3253504.1 phage tail protein [Serratia fonticola]
MTIETFTFAARVNPTGEHTFRVREVQFGDGYKQQIGDGLNVEIQSWSLTFVSGLERNDAIKAFFSRHGGYKAFKWINPSFKPGLFTCKTYQETALGKNGKGAPMFQIVATFEVAFKP